MSKAKDRARAESGFIFRDGHLVRKVDWYAAHPTNEMLRLRQATVDEALAAEMAGKFDVPTKELSAEERGIAGPPPFDYECSKCGHIHKCGTKVHENHQSFAKEVTM